MTDGLLGYEPDLRGVLCTFSGTRSHLKKMAMFERMIEGDSWNEVLLEMREEMTDAIAEIDAELARTGEK